MDSPNNKLIDLSKKAKKALLDFLLFFPKYFRKAFSQDGSRKNVISRLMQKISIGSSKYLPALRQTQYDKKLVFSLAKSRIPSMKQLKYVKKFLSRRETIIINICLAALAVNLIIVGAGFYKSHLQTVPVNGGKYTEGLIGSPKYINPIYANVSDVDSDIASLIYSSLFKRDGEGKLAKDLAVDYKISGDNKVYTFKIRQGVKWHDGADLTASDIIFTFNAIKDAQYRSPLRASFSGVDLKKIDDNTIEFTLSEPYAAFLELLTFGILPGNLWQQIPAESASLAGLNLKPVGSGPYKFSSVLRDDKTGAVRLYNLARNEDYYDDEPYIDELSFRFYPGFEEAIAALNLNDGSVDGISYLPRQIKNEVVAQDHLNYYQLKMPQLTALFFNQKGASPANDKIARQALAIALDKNKIIKDVMGDDAFPIDGPILPDSFAYDSEMKKYPYKKEQAEKLLDDAGWKSVEITEDDIAQAKQAAESEESADKKKTAEAKLAVGKGKWRAKDNVFLTVKLTALDNAENQQAVEMIKDFWRAIGVKADIELTPAAQIQNDVIKPRNYDILLYSIITGADPDPYAFWHSSQINGGSNITNYSNKEVDQLLEDARLAGDAEVRKEKYKKFQEILAEDEPAIFLYSPVYTYVQTKKVKGFAVKNILAARDRFSNIVDWYMKTGRKLTW